MLWQQHCCTWIPTNCPGAGHILIFNNGHGGRGYTSVDEIVPPVDAYGNYSRTTGAAFGPASLYWTYTNNPATNFYCSDIGGAERQPNGNTLITHGTHGTLFEVTTNGTDRVVLRQPRNHRRRWPKAPPSRPIRTMAGQCLNEVFKVHRYADQLRRPRRQRPHPARHRRNLHRRCHRHRRPRPARHLGARPSSARLSAVTATSSHSGNGLTDIQEYQYGLDPTVWSSTTNGIPDGWAIELRLRPDHCRLRST